MLRFPEWFYPIQKGKYRLRRVEYEDDKSLNHLQRKLFSKLSFVQSYTKECRGQANVIGSQLSSLINTSICPFSLLLFVKKNGRG